MGLASRSVYIMSFCVLVIPTYRLGVPDLQAPADHFSVRQSHVLLFSPMRPLSSSTIRHITRCSVPRVKSRGYHASVLPSLISTASPEFQARSTAMDELVRDLEGKMAKARLGGGPKAAERMRSKGKKLPRERPVSPPHFSQNPPTDIFQVEFVIRFGFSVSGVLGFGCA